MRNPNAPWEIRNDAARKRWLARGRTRRVRWTEPIYRLPPLLDLNTVSMLPINTREDLYRSLARHVAPIMDESWLATRWTVPE